MGLDMGAFNKAWKILKNLDYREHPLLCPKCRGTGIDNETYPKYGETPCRLCNGSGMRMSVNPMAMQQYQSQLPDEPYEYES